MVKTKNIYLLGSLLLMAAILIFNGCAAKTSGAVRDDSSLTGVSEELAPSGDYTGPNFEWGW